MMVCFFVILVSLSAEALSDPGIMPRQKDFTEHYDERSKVFRTREPQRFYDVVLMGHPPLGLYILFIIEIIL